MTDILVSEPIEGERLEQLAKQFSLVTDAAAATNPVRLAQHLATARAWIVRNQTQVTRAAMSSAPRLQVVARTGVGLDNIDTDAAEELGIVVTYTPNANTISVAELTLGMMIAWYRHLPAAHTHARAGGWSRQQFMGGELCGKVLGLIGLGRIGRHVAQRAAAFGMTIVGFDPFVSPDDAGLAELGITVVTWEALLSQADIVSIHVPLTEATRGLINAGALAQMKPQALLVNTSRGPIVDEAALVQALQRQAIAGAALDVREVEPPVRGLLEESPNVLLTPHIGAFTHEAQHRVISQVCEDVQRVLTGKPARRAVARKLPARAAN